MNDTITTGLMLIGAGFMLLAAVGILRLPDTLTRMQAATKAMTLGVAFVGFGAAYHFQTWGVGLRVLAIVAFLFLTAPVAAHLIGRVAYQHGLELWEGTLFDDLAEVYGRERIRRK